jgi:hypothetical protein
MSIRRTLVLSLLAVCLVAPAEAQRRRAVRSGPPKQIVNQCHTFGLVQAGTVGTYRTNTPQGDVNFSITWISDTPTRTHTTQKVQTPQGSSDVVTILDGEVVGALRGIKHLNVKTTTQAPVIGPIVLEVDIDFAPSLVAGPVSGWCEGATWDVPPVTETITTRGGPVPIPPQIVTTIASTGVVLAVDEVITVPAGTFHTVKYRGTGVSANGVHSAITWVSMERNIVVKQDTIDANGAVTSVTQLLSVVP